MLLRRYHEETSEPKQIMPKPEEVKTEDAEPKAEKPAKRKSRKASS